MAPAADETLLSAYLDGEVTADERRRVEQLLADNPAWRQLHDELRVVRAAFASLPRYSPSADLAGRVLRAVEAEQRAAGAGSTTAGAGDMRRDDPPRIASAGDRDAIRLRWPRHWRAWAWPALAVAAALLMMFSPQAERDRKLAKAPEGPKLSRDSQIGAAPARPRAHRKANRQAGANTDGDDAMQEAAEDLGEAAAGDKPTVAAKSAAGPNAAPATEGRKLRFGAKHETQKSEETPADGGRASGAPANGAPGAAAPAPVAAERRRAVGSVSGMAAGKGARPAEESAAPEMQLDDQTSAPQNAPAAKLLRRKSAESSGAAVAGVPVPEDERLGRALDKAAATSPAPSPLVVEIVVPNLAAGRKALEQALARNGITIAAPAEKDRATAKPQDAAKPQDTANATREQAKIEEKQARHEDDPSRPSAAVHEGETSVEASFAQIEATLAELRERPDEFTSVSVRPAPDSALQQPLADDSDLKRDGGPKVLRRKAELAETDIAQAQKSSPLSNSAPAAPSRSPTLQPSAASLLRAIFVLRAAAPAPVLETPPTK